MTLRALVLLLIVTASAMGQAVPMPDIPACTSIPTRGRHTVPSTSFQLEVAEHAQLVDVTVYLDNRHGRRFSWNAVRFEITNQRSGRPQVISPCIEFTDFSPMAAHHGPSGLFVVGWDERDGASRLERWVIEPAVDGLDTSLRVERVPITWWFDAAPTLDIAFVPMTPCLSRDGLFVVGWDESDGTTILEHWTVRLKRDRLATVTTIERSAVATWRDEHPVTDILLHPEVNELLVLSSLSGKSARLHTVDLGSAKRRQVELEVEGHIDLDVTDLGDKGVFFVLAQSYFKGTLFPSECLIAHDANRDGTIDAHHTVAYEDLKKWFAAR